MSTFTVGSFALTETEPVYGQAFTPNIAGPNGSGSPGSHSTVTLKTFSLGYSSSDTSQRAPMAYVYSVALDDPNQIGKGPNLVATNIESDTVDGANLFGSGTYYRKYVFSGAVLNAGSTYYVYFGIPQVVSFNEDSEYDGGDAYDTDVDDMEGECLQFQVEMSAP